MNNASEVFAAAVGHHKAGRLAEAARLFEQVVVLNPNHASAWHLRGITAWQLGQLPEAIEFIQRALAIEPRFIDAHNNLGLVFEQSGRLADASESLRRAIALDPGNVAALGNLGNVLRQMGQDEEAISCCRRAVELDLNSARTHYNLGVALHANGNMREAAASYQRAIALRPDFAEAIANLGAVRAEQGLFQEAGVCLEQAQRLRPEDADILKKVGIFRVAEGRFSQAVEMFRRAAEVAVNDAQAHLHLANALNRVFRVDEAKASCERALAINPALADAHVIRGDILKGLARVQEAIEAYRRALELRPDSAHTHTLLLYALYFCPGLDWAAIYAEHRRANEWHFAALSNRVQQHKNLPEPGRRLRIGYVSPNFRSHCQALITTPLWQFHDHEQFEIYCYSKTSCPDQVTEFVRSRADHWRNIYGLADAQVADLVRHDGIDILVDLTMFLEFGSPAVFAEKPAPVQLCWFAYPGTTGLTTIDYRFTDRHLDPPGLFDAFYSEQSIRLPHSFWCYDPLTTEPAVNRLPAYANGYVTFGCLNNFSKLNEGVLKLWAGLMKAVNGSRLILLAPEGSAREWVSETMGNCGIARDRITFVPFQKRSEYLATYQQIDIALETLPYNGHTTSLDSFWMGVPVPTIVGQTVVGRAGVSLLENLGLAELIARSPEEYVEVVSRLASDLPRLGELRAGLRERMERSPLMDGPQFTRDMEAAYRRIWERWCEGKQR